MSILDQTAHFLGSPDARQIIDLLETMDPAQRVRVVGILQGLRGIPTPRPNLYNHTSATRKREARNAHASRLLRAQKQVDDVRDYYEQELSPHWGANIDQFFEEHEVSLFEQMYPNWEEK